MKWKTQIRKFKRHGTLLDITNKLLISKKANIFHVLVDFGALSTPLLNYFGEFEAQKQKRKIPYVKPFPAFDSNRKSNVKRWRNLKKVFGFTKFVIERGLAAKLLKPSDKPST